MGKYIFVLFREFVLFNWKAKVVIYYFFIIILSHQTVALCYSRSWNLLFIYLCSIRPKALEGLNLGSVFRPVTLPKMCSFTSTSKYFCSKLGYLSTFLNIFEVSISHNTFWLEASNHSNQFPKCPNHQKL